jgi:hypothetical protein
MFAIIAAVLFAIVLILNLAGKETGPIFTSAFLIPAGLLCIALHLAGVGSYIRGYRGRRPGRG